MAGLIWAGIGKGLADAGTTAAATASAAMARDEASKIRAQERAEDKEFRAAQAAETRGFQESQNAMYRKLAGAGSSSSGGGGSGGATGPLTEEEKDFEALSMGKTRPEYDQFVESERTGDKSPYASYTMDQDGRGQPEYSPDFEKVQAAKRSTLAKIRAGRMYGKDLDNVVKGQQGMFALDVGQGVIGGTMDAGKGGTAIAAMKGDNLFTGDSNVTRQNFTGETTVTPVGQSQADENRAQANKARADATTGKTDANTAREQTAITNAERALTDRVDKLNKEAERQFPVSAVDAYNPAKLKAIMDKREAFVSGDKDVIRLRERVESMYAGNSGAATSKPAAKPTDKPANTAKPVAKNQAPAAKAGDNKGGNKAPYADGTKLTGPDGKRYVVRNGKPVLEK